MDKRWMPVLATLFILANGYNDSDYRLPSNSYPTKYNLEVDLLHPEADTFTARSWIEVNVTEENTFKLLLNVDPDYINVTSLDLVVDGSGSGADCSISHYNSTTQMMLIKCYNDLHDIDKTTQVVMNYHAHFSMGDGHGISRETFKVNGTQSYAIFTHFEPARFRRVFPSFDEPAFKAPIRLDVLHHDNLTVVSNMEPITLDTPLMSTYLLAIVAGPNDTWELYRSSSGNRSYNFTVFAQKMFKDNLSVVFENGPKLIDLMGNWTGMPYQTLGNTKMTFAALPLDGATENWGLITFREGLLIDEGIRTNKKALYNSLTTMAHEVSHQWFGNLVTLDWWSEVWLNEGFAWYFQFDLAHKLSEDFGFDKLFLVNGFQLALQDDGPSELPLSNNESNVNTEGEIMAGFGMSYHKGAAVIRMIRCALGEDVFQRGLQSYLKKMAYSNAKAKDLIANLQGALSDGTDVDLSTYLDAWIHQSGYPILKTSIKETDNNEYLVSINIYKYSTTLNKTDQAEQSIWYVPVTYATSDAPFWDNATTSWIKPGGNLSYSMQKTKGAWHVLNINVSGFYRVDYDVESLALITNVLNNSETYKQIPVLNRAQILDDLFNIAKYYTAEYEGNNDRPYMNALSISQYLKYEEEYVPWQTYLNQIQYLMDEIEDELTESTLKADVLKLVEAQIVIPNDTNSKDLTIPEVLKRNLLLEWACKAGHKDAVQYATTEFEKYKKDTTSIDTDYRNVIICYGMQNSVNAKSDYDILMNLYATLIVPQERQEILTGLGCMRNTQLLSSFLNITLAEDPPVDKQFWTDIFEAIYTQSPEGLDVALRFVTENVEAIGKKWGATKFEKMLTNLGSKVVAEAQVTMLTNVLNHVGAYSDIRKAVVSALEQVSHNLEWVEYFGTEVTSILVYNGEPVPTTTTVPTTIPDHHNDATQMYREIYLFQIICSLLLLLYVK